MGLKNAYLNSLERAWQADHGRRMDKLVRKVEKRLIPGVPVDGPTLDHCHAAALELMARRNPMTTGAWIRRHPEATDRWAEEWLHGWLAGRA